MPKPNGETYQQWKARVLNPISSTFCGAKWGNATIWLGSGHTASCHHPPAHKIPLEEVLANHRALHNTKHKKMARADMLSGVQTPECDYCWRVENMNVGLVSDRTFKSVLYTDEELREFANKYGSTEDVTPRTLEIAFDNLCSFGCSYCNSNFSSTWATDIKTNGPYTDMQTKGHEAFQHAGEDANAGFDEAGNNPYLNAFWKWWEEDGGLADTLLELRITGGEALMSPSFWKLLDWYKDNPGRGPALAVNSNMGCTPHLLERLIDRSKSIEHLEIYTSCENAGAQAEYVRDGLKWDTWIRNIEQLMHRGNVRHTHCMMTLSAIAAEGVVDFMTRLYARRQHHGNKYFLQTSFNVLRFPGFQSIFSLSPPFREELADELKVWLDSTSPAWLNEFEHASIVRYVEQLRAPISDGIAYRQRRIDLVSFLDQYDTRRGKDWKATFPRLRRDLFDGDDHRL